MYIKSPSSLHLDLIRSAFYTPFFQVKDKEVEISFKMRTVVSLLSLAAVSYALEKRASASAYSSNSAGNYKLSSITAPVQGAGDPGSTSTWKLSIDDTSSGHKQTIVGFGGAVTDATVTSFNTLSSSDLQDLLNTLMTDSGANFALMRHTIGASDLSGDPAYTYDDNGGSADTSLSGFNLGDRGTAMANMLASMKSIQSALTVFGSPWSAPGWMKMNGVIDGTTTDNNLNDGYLNGGTANSGYASQFADYFVKYIQAYKNLGVSIDAITIQNEPLNSQSGYPTMYVYAEESAELIQNYIGPALADAGLDTTVWAYDHNTGNLTPLSLWISLCIDKEKMSLVTHRPSLMGLASTLTRLHGTATLPM